MAFNENLRRLRELAELTQAQAAKAAGVAFRSYQNWEAGVREPRIEALRKLAAAFGVSADALIAVEAEPAKPEAKKKRKRKQ